MYILSFMYYLPGKTPSAMFSVDYQAEREKRRAISNIIKSIFSEFLTSKIQWDSQCMGLNLFYFKCQIGRAASLKLPISKKKHPNSYCLVFDDDWDFLRKKLWWMSKVCMGYSIYTYVQPWPVVCPPADRVSLTQGKVSFKVTNHIL